MKQFLLAAAVLTASLSGPASAADLARPRAHAVYGPAVAFYNWTGCYVGGNGGGFWARRDWSNPVFGGGGFGDETASGGLGGVQVGCNYQIGQWVLGVQGDWDWISATSSTANIAFPFFTDQSDTKSLASVTGRVGYAWGRFLLYGKGGGAWLRSDFSLQTAGAVFSVSETRSGWTVGVGGEYAFLDWLTGFIEYDHYGFRDDNGVSFGCGALCPIGTVAAFPINIRTDVDIVKAGLNLKFGPTTRW
ncbi:MAG: outer membrane beta-barrel protein [Xanthobacteraceae bacterium]|jgi:outer membrane immunogenic protein